MRRVTVIFAIAILTISCWFQPLHGWWNTGHMLVADVAYQHLTPTTKRSVDELIQVIGQHYPHGDTFVTSATWADELRTPGVFHFFDSWHYTEISYDPEGVLTEAQKKAIAARIEKNDIIWVIEEGVKVLKSSKANVFEKALVLRLLIHCVADLHQPIHAVTRYTKAMPDGDKGGNRFVIKGTAVDNLHKFWDSGCGRFPSVHTPPSPIALQGIRQQSLQLTKAHSPKSFPQRTILDPKTWAEESYHFAVSHVYTLPVGAVPNKKYVMRGRHLSEERIVLAGYRLANLLNSIFEVPSEKKQKKRRSLIVH